MKKINLEQKILLKRSFYMISIVVAFAISSYFSYIVSLILYFIVQLNWQYFFPYYDKTTSKYENTKVTSPNDILDHYILWKIFCIIYYSILIPMIFLGKLNNKSLMFSILISASPVFLLLLHSVIIFYKRLGGERIDIEAKPRKTLFKYEDDEDKF